MLIKPKLCYLDAPVGHNSLKLFSYGNVSLEVVDTFIYLGVNLSCNASFNKVQKHLSGQASKALYSLNSLFHSTCLYIQNKLKLFDVLVLPIINYGREVWGFHKKPRY